MFSGRGNDWRGKRERQESYPEFDRNRPGMRQSPPRFGSPPHAKRMRFETRKILS